MRTQTNDSRLADLRTHINVEIARLGLTPAEMAMPAEDRDFRRRSERPMPAAGKASTEARASSPAPSGAKAKPTA